MATAANLLTLAEFRNAYADEKPYYEYWFGEAVQKAVPTWLHAVLQIILCDFLREAGYKSGAELELRVDPSWQPKPDVVAALTIEHPYPSEPVAVVAEILSPDDRMVRVYEKCRQYQRIGVAAVFVFDPEAKIAWEWSREKQNLERLQDLNLPNGERIPVQNVWDELDRRR